MGHAQVDAAVEIRTRSGDLLRCAPEEILPRRFGIVLARRRLILEYEVPRLEILAHHCIDVGPGDGKEVVGAERSEWAEATARRLKIKHKAWLDRVSIEQLGDLAGRFCDLPLAEQVPTKRMVVAFPTRGPVPLEATEAAELQRLLLGPRANGSGLPPEWMQGWCFEPMAASSCPYGLRQAEGGPCGVVAPVQAFLLRQLLLSSTSPETAGADQCRAALFEALTDILFQCAAPLGDGSGVVRLLALPSNSKTDRTTTVRHLLRHKPEGCIVHEFSEREVLRSAWEQDDALRASYFVDPDGAGESAGVLLFLYSALATRGVGRVRADADIPTDVAMVGAHAYCSQEAANLLLTGIASSNVFDGERCVGGNEKEQGLRLCGVSTRPEVGFLTLFEAFGSLEVGSLLKRPHWPVWVVHAESHYSVLFGRQAEAEEDVETDVWYYDPLGRQDEEKRITVRPQRLSAPPEEDDLDSNGMIAKVIRTRWGVLADLDWNGAEPVY